MLRSQNGPLTSFKFVAHWSDIFEKQGLSLMSQLINQFPQEYSIEEKWIVGDYTSIVTFRACPSVLECTVQTGQSYNKLILLISSIALQHDETDMHKFFRWRKVFFCGSTPQIQFKV